MNFANRVEHSHSPGAFRVYLRLGFRVVFGDVESKNCLFFHGNGLFHVVLDMELPVTLLRHEKSKSGKSAKLVGFSLIHASCGHSRWLGWRVCSVSSSGIVTCPMGKSRNPCSGPQAKQREDTGCAKIFPATFRAVSDWSLGQRSNDMSDLRNSS